MKSKVYRNYAVENFIREQLKGFNKKFVECVVRMFSLMERTQDPDGCLSDSVALYICAKEYGYQPKLCYGICNVSGHAFYHAWLEIDDTVIDVAIYGNVKFGLFLRDDVELATPMIGKYEDLPVTYGRFEFEDDWRFCPLRAVEYTSFEGYMNGAPNNGMWTLTCRIMNRTLNAKNIEHLSSLIKGEYMNKDCPKDRPMEMEIVFNIIPRKNWR